MFDSNVGCSCKRDRVSQEHLQRSIRSQEWRDPGVLTFHDEAEGARAGLPGSLRAS